jgi:NAD(P)-dependent dehydrogenase (short-subunit alcohol dehydrogenase family)
VILLRADLRDPAQIARMAGEIETAPYPLRVWVNSAAVMPRASLRDISPDDWDATLALNLRAPLLCAQAAARLMGEAGGLIVNVSDVGAQKAWTGFPAYTVSKSALETLTRLLAKTLAPRVRVNAVAPGLVLPAADLPPEEWQRLVQRLPMKRPAEVEEVARVVGFFIDNPYVTGQILAVDGGYQLI